MQTPGSHSCNQVAPIYAIGWLPFHAIFHYITPEGEKVAFELEIARKSKERYQTKIKRYIQVMSEPQVASSLFDSIHYVCEKEKILDLIKSEVALYRPLFKFSLESELIK